MNRTSRLRADRKASVAVIAALGMTSIVGMTSLAVDYGGAYAQRAELQKAADAAAMAGAVSWVKTGSTTAVAATVASVVAAHGWSTSTIQQPGSAYLAISPRNATNPAIQVSLASPWSMLLAKAVQASGQTTIHAYAAVEIGAGSGASTSTVCVLSLSTIMVNGTVNANACTVTADGIGSNAITVNSGGKLTAAGINSVGGIVRNGTVTGTVTTGVAAVLDPFLGTQLAAGSGFTGCQNYSNQTTLSPGCWQNVNLNSGTSTTLSPGTYYFKSINVNSNATLTGTGGVTMITQQNFSPSGNISITAPTTGTFAGMAIYAMGGMNVNSGVTYNVNGAIYSPNSSIIPNSGAWNQNACTTLVAQSITFNGGTTFTLPRQNCGGSTKSIALVK